MPNIAHQKWIASRAAKRRSLTGAGGGLGPQRWTTQNAPLAEAAGVLSKLPREGFRGRVDQESAKGYAVVRMKLQYLGDSRDAFKWDLLHWLCTEAKPSFSRLVFVPLLTPDDANQKDGKTPHDRFRARPEIQTFVAGLGSRPRLLSRILELGTAVPGRRFEVEITPAGRALPQGSQRSRYWDGVEFERYENSLIFLDPDNGFETKTRSGAKWVRHRELEFILTSIPTSNAVVVYQHQPHVAWEKVFRSLGDRFSYAPFAAAAHHAGLAFVILARAAETAQTVASTAQSYCAQHGEVLYTSIKR
jgi:hypothetical protein